MIEIAWVRGEARGYSDLLPDSIISADAPKLLVHDVIGPGGGERVAKCAVAVGREYVDLDYEPFAPFNEAKGIDLGAMRITLHAGQPGKVLWRPTGAVRFTEGEAELRVVFGTGVEEYLAARPNGGVPHAAVAKRVADVRIGQAEFRRKLEKRWGGRCALTGLMTPALLRASHIKRWALCRTDEERLDGNNGLLLAAHVDALFDSYLITFASDGTLRWHPSVSQADQDALRLPPKLRDQLSDQEQAYFVHHRETFERH